MIRGENNNDNDKEKTMEAQKKKTETPKKPRAQKPASPEAKLKTRVAERMSQGEYDSWLYAIDAGSGFDTDEVAALREAGLGLGMGW